LSVIYEPKKAPCRFRRDQRTRTSVGIGTKESDFFLISYYTSIYKTQSFEWNVSQILDSNGKRNNWTNNRMLLKLGIIVTQEQATYLKQINIAFPNHVGRRNLSKSYLFFIVFYKTIYLYKKKDHLILADYWWHTICGLWNKF